LEAKPKEEDRAPLYLYRGQEYLAINALQPALRHFEEALRLDPNSADAYLGCGLVRVKLGEPYKGVADANRAVKGEPKEPRLWHGAARVYAQAAAQLKAGPGRDESLARIRSRYEETAVYEERAVVLLSTALHRVAAGQRKAYWRENVM